MKPTTRNYCNFTLSSLNGLMLGCLLASNPLIADDTEIYTGVLSGGFEEQIRPNILYIIDTSGSMDSSFYMNPADWQNRGPYDPNVTYPGNCDADRVYRRTVSDEEGDPLVDVPLNEDGYPLRENGRIYFQSCDSDNYFLLETLHCKAALDAFNTQGWYGVDYIREKLVSQSGWRNLNSSRKDNRADEAIRECDADWGIHGHNSINSTTAVYPVSTSSHWSTVAIENDRFRNTGRQYILASGNFLNWFYAPPSTRIELVQQVLKEIVQELPDDTNVGLMRFDTRVDSISGDQTDGGMMVKEFVRIGDNNNRTDFLNAIDQHLDADGPTPLAETLLEALYVFAGEKPYFGAASQKQGASFPSVPASIDGDGHYKSPISATCQQNAIVYFTDGAPTADNDAYGGRSHLDGIAGWVGGMDRLPNIEDYLTEDCDDRCMPYLAEYMQKEDINPYIPGDQHVSVYTIGFDPVGSTSNDPPDPDYLRETAEKGGGLFRMAQAYSDLKEAFQVITRRAISANTAFTAPALAVNAFNRTRDENRVYFALFRTSLQPGWGGNLKAYQFRKNPSTGELEIADSKSDPIPAIEPYTGLFAHDARSFWSTTNDGDDALAGGAAHRLPSPSVRNIYTWFGDSSTTLKDSTNAFETWNTRLADDAFFGLTGAEAYSRNDIIQWYRGVNPETSEHRYHMGDPLHSRPVVVAYGSDPADPQQRLFLTTNDGFLHIFDAATGEEKFAFVALETLKNAKRMYEKDATHGRTYGLDGAPVLHIEKADKYSRGINDGDKVYLYVGMRRGGNSYYAFDMTDPDDPKILWRIQGGDLNGNGVMDGNEKFFHLGNTFSTPRIGRIKIGTQERTILVFAGGYDTNQDYPYGTGETRDLYAEDSKGNAIYIVDAKTGERLWWASRHPTSSLQINELKNSIPSDVSLVDSDNNGWTDRIYVGDTGGRLFRIDINEFNDSGTIQAWGGMIADLGASVAADRPTPDQDEIIENNRKFFYPPDVVMVKDGAEEYLALAIGSGNREHPSYPIANDTAVKDKFFVLKDPHVINRPPDYNYGITMDPASLYDASNNHVMSSDADERAAALDALHTRKGWYIDLPNRGEKALAEAMTFNYQVMFTTFQPLQLDLGTCQARTGVGRLYILDIRNGKPVIKHFAGDPNELTTEDRSMELLRDGIPPAPMIAFPDANDGKPVVTVGPELPPVDPGSNMRKSYWYLKDE